MNFELIMYLGLACIVVILAMDNNDRKLHKKMSEIDYDIKKLNETMKKLLERTGKQ